MQGLTADLIPSAPIKTSHVAVDPSLNISVIGDFLERLLKGRTYDFSRLALCVVQDGGRCERSTP